MAKSIVCGESGGLPKYSCKTVGGSCGDSAEKDNQQSKMYGNTSMKLFTADAVPRRRLFLFLTGRKRRDWEGAHEFRDWLLTYDCLFFCCTAIVAF